MWKMVWLHWRSLFYNMKTTLKDVRSFWFNVQLKWDNSRYIMRGEGDSQGSTLLQRFLSVFSTVWALAFDWPVPTSFRSFKRKIGDCTARFMVKIWCMCSTKKIPIPLYQWKFISKHYTILVSDMSEGDENKLLRLQMKPCEHPYYFLIIII